MLLSPYAAVTKQHPQLLEGNPKLDFMLRMHSVMHDTVAARHDLVPAPTRVSDAHGVFERRSSDQRTLLRVQTLASPATAAIDHAHFTMAASDQFFYTKASVFMGEALGTPHFEMEMTAAGPQAPSPVLLYLSMDPRCHPLLDLEYLERYYTTPPPDAPDTSSWWDLEGACSTHPALTRFTSPSLTTRCYSSSALLYKVAWSGEGQAAAEDIIRQATTIWLAWLQHDLEQLGANTTHATSANQSSTTNQGPNSSVGGSEQRPNSSTGGGCSSSTSSSSREAVSWAWRRFPRLEPAAASLRSMFGEAVMEEYWGSIAGEPSIRL